jgi:hypothetical protein
MRTRRHRIATTASLRAIRRTVRYGIHDHRTREAFRMVDRILHDLAA